MKPVSGRCAGSKRNRVHSVFWQNEAKFAKVFKDREPSHLLKPRQTSDVRLLCMGLFFDFLVKLADRNASRSARVPSTVK